jgi:hypothetical protein
MPGTVCSRSLHLPTGLTPQIHLTPLDDPCKTLDPRHIPIEEFKNKNIFSHCVFRSWSAHINLNSLSTHPLSIIFFAYTCSPFVVPKENPAKSVPVF